MYAGRKVEEASVEELFARPLHPYTHGLMASIPRLASIYSETNGPPARLQEIPGMVPGLANLPAGCAFAPRCPFADATCERSDPPLVADGAGREVACWHTDRVRAGEANSHTVGEPA
jgi:peptide/nickel transport system ATP-binding protein